MGEGEEVEAALAELAAYSLIELEADGFGLHRLLQAVLRDRLDSPQRSLWVEHAVQLVKDYAPFESDDVRTWPVWDRVRPHATAILQEAWTQSNPTAAILMVNLGVLLQAKALYAEAEPLYRRALAIDEKRLGPEHPEVATCLNNLAQLLQDTNLLAEAEPLLRRAVAIAEKSLVAGHPWTETFKANYASLQAALAKQGR